MTSRRPGRPSAHASVDRRARIIEAAEALVTEGGTAAATVRAVAARAGVSSGTLRHYFPSQNDLAVTIAQRQLALNLNDFRIHDTSIPPRQRLLECLGQFLGAGLENDAALHHAEQWFILMTNAIGPHATDLGAAMVEGLARSARERMREWLALLAQEGALDSGSVEFTADVLWTRIDGLALGILSPGGLSGVDAAMAILRHDVDLLIAESVNT